MTIASQIQDYADGLTAAYNMVSQRGGTIPQRKNMDNLTTAIATIPSGGSSTGIPVSVTNGVYGPKKDESFTFSLPSTATDLAYAVFYHSFSYSTVTSVDLSSLTSLSYGTSLGSAFSYCNTITSLDMSSLRTVSGMSVCDNMCQSCKNLTSIDLSSLETISGSGAFSSAFSGCRSLQTVDLSSLTTISSSNSQTFYGCTGLTSIDLSSLTTVASIQSMFQGCTALTSVDLSSVTTLYGTSIYNFYGTFQGCTSLTSLDVSGITSVAGHTGAFREMVRGCTNLQTLTINVSDAGADGAFIQMCYNSGMKNLSFPNLSTLGTYTNQFNNMLQGTTGCTVHFPAAMQATISALASYPSFGGTSVTVLFDL